jgi:hypothetical protein
VVKVGIFDKVTQGDLREVRHAIELLDTRIDRLQKSQKSASASMAGLSRRLKKFEDAVRIPPGQTVLPEVEEDEEGLFDEGEPLPLVDRETERIRLRNGQ